jgi:hypothetical protein
MLLILLVSEATMSAHAFEALSRARGEIEVRHTAEGHCFKFFVVTNAHGKRILSESVCPLKGASCYAIPSLADPKPACVE